MKEGFDHLRYSDVHAVTQEMQEKCPEPRKILLSIMLPTAKKNYNCNGDCPMFRRFYVQKILAKKVLCSEGSIFRR